MPDDVMPATGFEAKLDKLAMRSLIHRSPVVTSLEAR